MLSTQDIDSGLSDKRDKLSFSPRTRKDYSAFCLLKNRNVAETRKILMHGRVPGSCFGRMVIVNYRLEPSQSEARFKLCRNWLPHQRVYAVFNLQTPRFASGTLPPNSAVTGYPSNGAMQT